MAASPIGLLLADVDGTLVTQDKVLTSETIDAVHRLGEANILFAITSGRPPRDGHAIEPLDLQTPIAAFNGGLIVDRDMTTIEQRNVPEDLVVPIADLMTSFDAERMDLPRRGLVRPRPQGRPRRSRGLDGQVRAQGHERPRWPDRRGVPRSSG